MIRMQKMTLLPPEELFGAVEQLLQEGYDVAFTVTGNSMWPLLAHGRDQVTVRAMDANTLRKGDVVLFCPEDGRYLLHRVTHLKDGLFQTAGDSNCFHDGFFPPSCVLGRVVCFCRKGKNISCQNPFYRLIGWLWMLLFPARRGLLRILRSLKKRRKRP